ncbi:MAG: DUF3040 domain-containing protein [Actinobacteria bacterium]|nr:DUF3040 domain-containing protein [Actinomycetota bacterium]
MPLSDHEQRLLDQIEQALYAEDPKFANNVRSARGRRMVARRWIPLSIFGVLVGLLVVFLGLSYKQIAVGVVGFVLILAAVAYATRMISTRSAKSNATGSPNAGAPAAKPRPSGLRARMEDRLRRRFDES